MSEVHRYNVVKMLSAEGNAISYSPHGPEVVMAAAYDALRQQLADVSNERDGLRALRDQLSVMKNDLFTRLNASEARNAEWAAACKALSRSVHGFNEEQWERVHALIAQSAPATDKQGTGS